MFDFLSKAGGSLMDSLSDMGSAVGSGLETMGEYAGKGLSHTFERLQDPDVQQQLHLLGAVMSDDQNRYQGALNAYEKRRSEIASQKREDARRAEDREFSLADWKRNRDAAMEDRAAGYEHDFLKMEKSHANAIALQNSRPTSGGGSEWDIKGGYKINKSTGEVIRLGEGEGEEGPTAHFTSGGKMLPVGYDEGGNLWYKSSHPDYFVDGNGQPTQRSNVGKVDSMDPIKRQEYDRKASEDEAAFKAPAKASADLAASAKKIIEHKNFENAYGNIDGKLPAIRQGTQDVINLIEQAKGQIFLGQRQFLKGQGQITDYESKRAEAALTIASNRTSSASAARAAWEEIMELDRIIQDRVSRGVDTEDRPIKHRRSRDPLEDKPVGIDRSQVEIQRN